jgi:hypothetical protein
MTDPLTISIIGTFAFIGLIALLVRRLRFMARQIALIERELGNEDCSDFTEPARLIDLPGVGVTRDPAARAMVVNDRCVSGCTCKGVEVDHGGLSAKSDQSRQRETKPSFPPRRA